MAEKEIPVIKKSGFKYKCYLAVKRVFDVVASLLFILVFSWLYLIIALAVKISDGGKVFYKHRRLGKSGKIISLLKFRSMMEGADNISATLNPDERKTYEKEYKVDNDARITRLGRFLRNTSLDELPNFFSVLKGDISLVGPRPIMELEAIRKYGDDKDKLLSVRPGMIGLWAVNGRSNLTYESGERQKAELYYAEHCSIALDIKIMVKAVRCVFSRKGAK